MYSFSLRSVQLASYEVRVRAEQGVIFVYTLCLLRDEPPARVLTIFAEIAQHTNFNLIIPAEYEVLSVANVTTRTVHYWRNEWDLFADVHQRLAAGAQVVTYYFDKRLAWPPDEQAGGVVLDDEGNEYHLGSDFTRALNECIRAKLVSWGIRMFERTISFGPGAAAYVDGKEATYTIGPDADSSIEPA